MKEERINNWESKIYRAILLITFIVLFIRLWDLQIIKGDEMRLLSERNRVRIKKILAPRGTIYDRNGKILADTRPSFNLYIVPEDIKDFNQTVDGLSNLLSIDREEIICKLKMAREFPLSFPIKIKSDISLDEVAKVEAHKIFLPGVTVQVEPKRFYPLGEKLAHVIGYVTEIGREELRKYKDYQPGDYIGKYGLERQYEEYLRGKDGEKKVEVDATGREVRLLEIKEPVSGNDLFLNIDMDLQNIAEEAMANKKGGLIVLNPKTGEVLALVSKPSFDPNRLSSGITPLEWKKLISNKSYPLMNRVLQGRYPPGSTFKIVLALKALEDGLINESTTFLCRGGLHYGNRFFRCWKEKGHGSVNLHKAIVESCDVFFYQVGLKLGVDRIHEMASKIGLTKPSGIDLPEEKAGIVPSKEWKLKQFHVPWFEGETLSVSIGQGYVWLTPIALAQLSSFVANEGILFKPRLVNRIVAKDGKILKRFEPEVSVDIKIKRETANILKDGLEGVVNEKGGTAYASRIDGANMCGKTGTAQIASLEKGKHLGDHAWFIAFAPKEDPSIAMCVFVERGGHGATAAAPVAKKLTEIYMEKNIKRLEIKTAGINENR